MVSLLPYITAILSQYSLPGHKKIKITIITKLIKAILCISVERLLLCSVIAMLSGFNRRSQLQY